MTRLDVILLLMAIVTVALARWASADAWRAELVPLMLFGMTMAIVYRQELALLLAGMLALIVALAIGHGLHEFLLLMGVTTAAVLNLGRIRSRSKLIYVGLFAGVRGRRCSTSAMGMLDNQPLGWPLLRRRRAATALWAVAAGFLMTGLLPFIEQLFGVLTDLSLLELGDVAHPLLAGTGPPRPEHLQPLDHRRLDRRGGRREHRRPRPAGPRRGLFPRHRQDAQAGLFHRESGRRRQPPRDAGARHEHAGDHRPHQGRRRPGPAAPPAAADHRLDRAAPRHDAGRVSSTAGPPSSSRPIPTAARSTRARFRYPGPKPQTKEAAVLMLADAVESASRTLVDPTPARIESLVREIAERRLHDGQFDESGLTLRELRTIEDSLVKSLTADLPRPHQVSRAEDRMIRVDDRTTNRH